jgi:Ca2+-binding RTX toxin-like protein
MAAREFSLKRLLYITGNTHLEILLTGDGGLDLLRKAQRTKEAHMATHTIDHDRTAQWKINASNDTWTLAKNTELHVTGAPAIIIGAAAHDNRINIDGHLVNSGADSYGIYVHGAHNTITFGKDSRVDAAAGVYGYGDDTTVNNKGEVNATYYGVFLDAAAHVVNSGVIRGLDAVAIGHDPAKKMSSEITGGPLEDSVVNRKGGEIWGGEAGVLFRGEGDHSFVNDGFVSGANAAVANTRGSLYIVNRGRIDGDILFGDSADTLDTRHGKINGEVNGGGGDDTFVIDSKSIQLVEEFNDGYDTVKTSVNYTMADNLDKLVMLGKDNLVAHGSDIANFLQGNAGNNKLFGEFGNDQLAGGKGTDFLAGGDGYDTFIFHKGDGVDTVTDFNDATDTMSLSGFAGVGNFAELSSHLSAHGDDVWVSFGSDKLILHDTALSDMNAADFLFPV